MLQTWKDVALPCAWLSVVLGSNALNDVLKVCPFGMPTFLFDGWPVDFAPPFGLMKLLVAPESSIALWPNFCLMTLLGSLANFLSCNFLLNES